MEDHVNPSCRQFNQCFMRVFFVRNFGAKNYKAAQSAFVQNFGAKNVLFMKNEHKKLIKLTPDETNHTKEKKTS